MRINSVPPKELYRQYVHVNEKLQAPHHTAASLDRVELTGEAKTFSATLKAVKEAMGAKEATDPARLSEIKQQIADSAYSVPGYMVAAKMLRGLGLEE